MGIKNINKLLRAKCNKGISSISISKFANQIIFIDTSIFMYRYKHSGNLETNFVQLINKLLQFNIKPIFIFDGKPDDNKIVIEERKLKKEKAKNKIIKLQEELLEEANKSGIIIVDNIPENININEDLPDSIQYILNRIEKVKKNNIVVTWKDFSNIKKLLYSLNISFIQGKCETDIIIPYLAKKYNINPLCLSYDSDFLAYGVNLLSKFDNRSGFIEYYDINVIRKELGLTNEEFVDMSVLMGCDYCKSLKGIGPMTAYKIIKKHKNMSKYFQSIKRSNIEEYINAKNMFLNIPELSIELPKNIEIKKINKQEFNDVCNELEVSEVVKNNIIKTTSNRYNPITKYFKVKK